MLELPLEHGLVGGEQRLDGLHLLGWDGGVRRGGVLAVCCRDIQSDERVRELYTVCGGDLSQCEWRVGLHELPDLHGLAGGELRHHGLHLRDRVRRSV